MNFIYGLVVGIILSKVFLIILEIYKNKNKSTDIDISVGDIFIDKTWGDTEKLITQISSDKTKVRYKYIVINGVNHTSSSIYSTTCDYIKESHYKKLI